MLEDLRWLGIAWSEGPDCGGSSGPYAQSERRDFYLAAWKSLRDRGFIYPCSCSRRDVAQAAGAPNEGDDEPVYPGTCRPVISGSAGSKGFVPNSHGSGAAPLPSHAKAEAAVSTGTARHHAAGGVNWRFRVPDGEEICFNDLQLGAQRFVAGRDFGDFIVWRRDDVPAYQLAVVVDDAAMRITEVVRGADLLKSAARQILLFRALGLAAPDYYHCDLVRDEAGVRLAIEPLNRYETYFAFNADQALRLAETTSPSCGVALDVFHMNVEEADPLATIARVGERIADFHVSDTNRLAAGMGHWVWPETIDALRKAGYDGALTLEFVPARSRIPVFADGLEQAALGRPTEALSESAFCELMRRTAETLRPLIS